METDIRKTGQQERRTVFKGKDCSVSLSSSNLDTTNHIVSVCFATFIYRSGYICIFKPCEQKLLNINCCWTEEAVGVSQQHCVNTFKRLRIEEEVNQRTNILRLLVRLLGNRSDIKLFPQLINFIFD